MKNNETRTKQFNQDSSLAVQGDRFIDGFWVHLNQGNDQIDVYFSNYFWRRAIYFNGKKVSQKSCSSTHDFEVGGQKFQIRINHSGFKDGKCELYCDNILKDSADFSWYNEETKTDYFKLLLLHGVFGAGFGAIALFSFLTLFRLFS